MTWTRLDDLWCDSPQLSGLPYDVRWHYLALIQFCSRTKQYDGRLRRVDARRASDVDDPEAAAKALADAGLVRMDESLVIVERIDEHIPPPSVRENSAQSKVRMRRHRKHKNGDHSECLPESCPHLTVDPSTGEVTSVVTHPVTRNTRTGQDRTGQDWEQRHDSVTSEEPHEDELRQWLNGSTTTEASTRHLASGASMCVTCMRREAEPGTNYCTEHSSARRPVA